MRDFRNERGFGLVEATVATLITMVGVLAVAVLFLVGTRMQSNATNSSSTISLATAEIERIRTLRPSAAERADGGSLTADQPDHFAMRGPIDVRWRITTRPTLCAPTGGVPGAALECARDITVVAISPNGQAIRAQLTSILWR
jgi:Tfp pilus assembly protein PilV